MKLYWWRKIEKLEILIQKLINNSEKLERDRAQDRAEDKAWMIQTIENLGKKQSEDKALMMQTISEDKSLMMQTISEDKA